MLIRKNIISSCLFAKLRNQEPDKDIANSAEKRQEKRAPFLFYLFYLSAPY